MSENASKTHDFSSKIWVDFSNFWVDFPTRGWKNSQKVEKTPTNPD